MDVRLTLGVFLDGAVAMGCSVAGLFFLRFWRQNRDAVFLAFALAFWLFAANYTLLGLVPVAAESRPYMFLPRLTGFAIIVCGAVFRVLGVGRRLR